MSKKFKIFLCFFLTILLLFFVIVSSKSKIFAVVVPHHDIVAEQRAEFLAKISYDYEPETIILISPDHFGKSRKAFTTTDKTWKIKNGSQNIFPDQRIIDRITKDLEIVDNRSDVFDGEHGIKNILGDIGKYFPNAKIVPIVVSSTANRLNIVELADEFNLICKKKCSVIASVDMSHYLPAHLAEIHDIKTIRSLFDGDEDRILESEVDSRESLLFLTMFAKENKLFFLDFFANTNSGMMVGNYIEGVTTHILGGYVKKIKERERVFQHTFTFIGGKYDSNLLGQSGFYHKRLGETFARAVSGTDYIWNLSEEYVVNEIQEGESEEDILKKLKIQKRFDYFKTAIISWQFPCTTKHSEYQEKVAKAISDTGVNLVLGSCGNTIQDSQIIKGKNGNNTLVLYSLGNTDIDNVSNLEQRGILLSGIIGESKLELRIFNFKINDNVFSFTYDKNREEKISIICSEIKENCDLSMGIVKLEM